MPRSAALVPVSEDTDMQLQAAPVWSLPNPSTVLNVELALPPQLVSWMRGVSEQSQRGNTEEIIIQCMQEFRDYRKALHGLDGDTFVASQICQNMCWASLYLLVFGELQASPSQLLTQPSLSSMKSK